MIAAMITGKLASLAQSRSDGPSGRPFVTARLQVRQQAGDFIAVFVAAADPAVMRTLLAAEPFGGMAALRAKSQALCEAFIALVEARCGGHGLGLAPPRDAALRGSQVSLLRSPDDDGGAYAIVQALIARGVVGDYREPGILRFGFTPAYLRFVDVWDAVEQLVQVLDSGEWRESRFHQRAAVT